MMTSILGRLTLFFILKIKATFTTHEHWHSSFVYGELIHGVELDASFWRKTDCMNFV